MDVYAVEVDLEMVFGNLFHVTFLKEDGATSFAPKNYWIRYNGKVVARTQWNGLELRESARASKAKEKRRSVGVMLRLRLAL